MKDTLSDAGVSPLERCNVFLRRFGQEFKMENRNLHFIAFALGLVASTLFGLKPSRAQTTSAEWTHTAISPISTTAPTSTAFPSIVIAAISGTQHVADCLSISVQGDSNQFTEVQLLDGTTPLMQWEFRPTTSLQTNTIPPGAPTLINLCGLNIAGTAGNTMTLKASNPAAGSTYGTNSFVSFNIVGHDYTP